MKRTKRVLSVLLSLIIALAGLAALCVPVNAAYKVGDSLYYGSYPQTDVTATLGAALNALGGEWTVYGSSYGYSSGINMRYKDVTYNGGKYRGVTFDNYRPIFTNTSSLNNVQSDNGYVKKTVYWFKYEPLRWRVLDPSTGFIMCDALIDSQPFNGTLIDSGNYSWGDSSKTYYASNYAKSSIRTWLNADFYNTAFSATEKAQIKTTALTTASSLSSDYDAPATNDKIFLLSLEEATKNAYGFSASAAACDMRKLMEGTDYAKCQGLWVCRDEQSVYSEFSCWWLRTPLSSAFAGGVEHDGHVNDTVVVNHTNFGVCPALKVQNLNSLGLTGIAVKTMPTKTVYTVGESFDQSGLTLTATYTGGIKKTVTSGFTCTGFNSATTGSKTVTVTYEGKTTTFTVTVNPAAASLTGIAVKTMPTKTVYNVGDSFSQSGLTLTATYSDGSSKTISSGFTCSGFSSVAAGTKTITVTYQGKTTTFTVTVKSAAATLTGIAIKAAPSKTVYTYRRDKNLDITGLEIEATYSDGSKTPIDPAACTISGYSAKPAGNKTITVAYEGQTAQFTVTVQYLWWQRIIRIVLLGFLWY